MRILDTLIKHLEVAADSVYAISTEDEKYEAYSEIADIADELECEVKVIKHILEKYGIDYGRERFLFFTESAIE